MPKNSPVSSAGASASPALGEPLDPPVPRHAHARHVAQRAMGDEVQLALMLALLRR